jgi:hypothetical protein
MGKSLADYAVVNPQRNNKVCWVCTCPFRQEIDEGMRSGLYSTLIREWLVNEHGYKITECTLARLQNHFARGHHEKSS